MLALRIFRHSMRQVIGNWQAALRLALVPNVILYLVLLSVSGGVLAGVLHPSGPGAVLLVIAMLLVAVVTGAWVAVGWHRFVLLNEPPAGFLPPLHTDRMKSYLGRSVELGALSLGLSIVVAIGGMALGNAIGPTAYDSSLALGFLVGLATFAAMAVILGRVSLILPAAALGKDLRMGQSWAATRGQGGTLFILTLMFLALSVILALPEGFLRGLGLGVLAIAWRLVVQIGLTLLLLSILTTLYGHFVERRALV